MVNKKLIAIMGTNASGKSTLGFQLAKFFHGEIISADSRQLYKGLDLGSGKVSKEEMAEIPHHMINILDVNESFSACEFQFLAYQAIDSVLSRGAIPFLVGGTGLYVRAVTEGYTFVDVQPDPALREKLSSKSIEELNTELKLITGRENDSMDLNRRSIVRKIEKAKAGILREEKLTPKYDVLKLGLTWDKEVLHKRIAERLDLRIKQGMIEEVVDLVTNGATGEFLEGLGLEYRLIYRYINGHYPSFQAFRDDLYMKICHFAKRQMTWFRKEQNIIWLNSGKDYFAEAVKLINDFI